MKKYLSNLSKTRVMNKQSWLSDYDSEQVLAKMSPEEYLKMSIIFFYFSVKSKEANLIRFILSQKFSDKMLKKVILVIFQPFL